MHCIACDCTICMKEDCAYFVRQVATRRNVCALWRKTVNALWAASIKSGPRVTALHQHSSLLQMSFLFPTTALIAVTTDNFETFAFLIWNIFSSLVCSSTLFLCHSFIQQSSELAELTSFEACKHFLCAPIPGSRS